MLESAPETAQEPHSGPETPKKPDSRPCVRCGTETRADETFLGAACLADRRTKVEIAEAVILASNPAAQRAWLVATHGWKGGWSARRGSVRA